MGKYRIVHSDFPELAALANEYLKGLFFSNADIFTYAGIMSRVENFDGRAKLRPLSIDMLRYEVSRACQCVEVRTKRDGTPYEIEVFPNISVVRAALTATGTPFYTLDGIVRHPVIAPDGTILAKTGYDPATRLYVDVPDDFLISVPDNPTPEQIENARNVIFEMFIDFPFPDRASVAGAVAMFLTMLVRPLIDGPVPIFLVLAPAPGTGKTLLITATNMAVCGESPALLTETRDGDELSKILVAALLESPEMTAIDNINGKFDSGNLAAVVTAGRLRGRILGRSEIVDIPVRTMFVVTANNPAVSNELARRSVPIVLEANTAAPWMRDGFRHPDLLSYIKMNRAEIVSAGLTLARAWIMQGRKKPKGKPLGSFEAWYNVAGGILESAGIPGLLENAAEFYGVADVETATWTSFLVEWQKAFPVGGVPSRDLVELALKCEVIDEGRNDRATQTALGRALSKMNGRVFGRLKVKRLSVVSGLQFWKVEAV